MPREPITRLNERPGAARGARRIIDSDYKVVRNRRWSNTALRFIGALALAALIGALLPPAVLVAQSLADFLNG